MSNDTATIVPNALPVNDYGVYDGVVWFRTGVSNLDYAKYAAMPKVVSFKGMMFVKMGWNTDNGTVSYKESKDIALA
jgi:hypothetical protein